MANTVSRRDFIKMAGGAVAGGAAVIAVGNRLDWLTQNRAHAATLTIDFHITDAIKEMATHNSINSALCYFWIYKSVSPLLEAECPGPTIMARQGDTINITVTNDLDEPHSFFIPGLVDSGSIAPGASWSPPGGFVASVSGAHLYYDRLNQPVNRVMGLHGALIVIPSAPPVGSPPGTKITPYDTPTPAVQQLFDDFGSAHFPGLAWEEGDPATGTPPFRHYLWLLHQASPRLFRQVGELAAGVEIAPNDFMNQFLRDPFQVHAYHTDNPGGNRKPQYFTVNGQSGHFAHANTYITPMGRVGEPAVVYILNAGLWTHSMHLHANHFYVTSVNGVVNANPIWVDVFRVNPLDRIDYTVPYMRPPDVPNARGIGFPDTPLTSTSGRPTWPPVDEMNLYFPELGTQDVAGRELGQRLSPLCYPMHDHSEPSQTSQGGNYNTGLISGMYFTGDRNAPVPGIIPPGMPATYPLDFPMDEDWGMMFGDGSDRGVNILPGTYPAGPSTIHP